MKITVGTIACALSYAQASERKTWDRGQSLVKMWEWTSNIDDNDSGTTQEILFTGDIGSSYDIPIGFDYVDNYYVDQSVSIWIGGTQKLEFTHEDFEIKVELDAFPLWIDVLYNEINFNTTELTLCDSLWWYAELAYFYMEVTVAFNSCWAGIYDNFEKDLETVFDCNLEYYHLHNLLNLNFYSTYGNWFVNTCDREYPGWVKAKEQGGPRFEKGVWPEETDFFAGSEEVSEEMEEPEIEVEEVVVEETDDQPIDDGFDDGFGNEEDFPSFQ